MKVTLNLPDNAQLDLVKLGAQLEIPVEKVVTSALCVGVQIINNNPALKRRIKEQWKKEVK
jgi:small basic protein